MMTRPSSPFPDSSRGALEFSPPWNLEGWEPTFLGEYLVMKPEESPPLPSIIPLGFEILGRTGGGWLGGLPLRILTTGAFHRFRTPIAGEQSPSAGGSHVHSKSVVALGSDPPCADPKALQRARRIGPGRLQYDRHHHG